MKELPKILFQQKWLEKRLFRKEDPKEDLALKKSLFLVLAPSIPVVLIASFILYLLKLPNISMAMFIFSMFQLLLLSILILAPRYVSILALINQYFVVLFSLVCVLYFGGILNSAGAILLGLASVINSISFLKPKQTKILLIVYLLTILLEVIFDPFLRPLPEITQRVNLILFAVHLLVIAYYLITVLSFYFEKSTQIKKMEAEHLKELDSVKTKFYTNITHEFRTPITVILGLSVNTHSNTKSVLTRNMELVRQNGFRLLQLVNQMLDLSKIEASALQLNQKQDDLYSYIRKFTEPFRYLAKERDLQLEFIHEPEKLMMDFDPDKIESLIGNIVFNSIKFSNAGQAIKIKASLTSHNNGIFNYSSYGFSPLPVRSINTSQVLQLQISDHGLGIESENLPHIFERFYQGNEMTGSGIGLLLVKELVHLMNGNIFVKSEPGKGTKFTIFLPVTNLKPVMKSKDPITYTDQQLRLNSKKRKKLPRNFPGILIIEDNDDLVYVLNSALQNSYLIDRATNGKIGVEMALETLPDIIISDIMMPEMDGYEVCRILKNDYRTSHIPIILLTAKADFESKISGLKTGADYYLTKPFEGEELKTIIKNLIENREKLKARFRTMVMMPDKANFKALNPDETFLNKLRAVMNTNYSEDHFGTAQLTREMGMSRVQLFRKLKALTGLSVSRFIRIYRLKAAKHKIEKTKLTISEIAYGSGFSDPANFTHAFNKEFGMPPSKAREKTQENETLKQVK